MYRIKKKIGSNTIEIEGESFKKLCFYSSQVPALEKCDVCEKGDLVPHWKNIKENDYFSIKCSCGAEYKLGQKKDGKALYYKADTVFEKYVPETAGSAAKAPGSTGPLPTDDEPDDDIPF